MNSQSKPLLLSDAPGTQQGAALLVSLVILLVLTVLAVSSMQGTSLQERMVSAQRDAQAALEGAEHALTEAEDLLGQAVVPTFTNTDGLFTEDATNVPRGHAALFSDCIWIDAADEDPDDNPGCSEITREASMPDLNGGAMLAEPPRFFIQQLAADAVSSNNNMPLNAGGSYGSGDNDQNATVYRVVARSTGASGQSPRVIEAYVIR